MSDQKRAVVVRALSRSGEPAAPNAGSLPVILAEEDFEPWLRNEAGLELLKPAPEDLLALASVTAGQQIESAGRRSHVDRTDRHLTYWMYTLGKVTTGLQQTNGHRRGRDTGLGLTPTTVNSWSQLSEVPRLC